MDKNGIEFRPVGAKFGVEVIGVDLTNVPDQATKQLLRDAWYKHALLLFRGQALDDAQLDRVAQIFGEISAEGDFSSYVSNVDPKGLVPAGELKFHMDFSWSDRPLRGLMLYGYEVPPEGAGGDTLFANVKLALENLPPALRQRIAGLNIVHSTEAVREEGYGYRSTSVHPIVFPHPITQEPVLYCSPRHFMHIEGLSDADSEALKDELASYIGWPDIVYRHQWRPHDLLVWDNIKLQHARTNFDSKYRRHLRRIQIAAPTAVPA